MVGGTIDLAAIERTIKAGPYTDDWASLSRYTVPQWYQDAKFGIFIHWGVYSVPAFGSEWYPRNMYRQGSREFEHHRAVWGDHRTFGYKDFIPLFKAERFDADAWASLFREAGAKYVVPVAEHHDGFQMYPSRLSPWNVCQMGPKRDTMAELAAACGKYGLMLGASSHRAEHWFFMGHGREFPSDIHEPLQKGDLYWPAQPEPDHYDLFSEPAPSEEFLEDWLLRTCELVDRCRPKVLYFDWWVQHSAFRPYLKKLAACYYNRAAEWGTGGVINYKQDAFPYGAAVPDVERGQFTDTQPCVWQSDMSVALNSWGYTEGNVFRDPADLICDLVDIVSKNGNLLLNIGPRADGTITDEETAVLRRIGRWLKVNGEAIYGARVYRTFGEGPTTITGGQFSDGVKKNFTSQDFRFTMNGGKLYATALRCSDQGRYLIRTLAVRDPERAAVFSGIIDDVDVLGSDEKPLWARNEEGLSIETDFRTDAPLVFRITLR